MMSDLCWCVLALPGAAQSDSSEDSSPSGALWRSSDGPGVPAGLRRGLRPEGRVPRRSFSGLEQFLSTELDSVWFRAVISA